MPTNELGRGWKGAVTMKPGDIGVFAGDVRKNKGKHLLLSFATKCRLPLTNTFFSTRKGGAIYHTHNGISPKDHKRIDYDILPRRTH